MPDWDDQLPAHFVYRREYVCEGKDHYLNSDFDSAESAMAAIVEYCGDASWLYSCYDIVMQVRL